MAEIPPPSGPPPNYAAYPRDAGYGTAAQLRLLADGYFGLNKIFVINIVLVFALRFSILSIQGPSVLAVAGIGLVIIGLVVGFGTYPYNKKIGEGANWGQGMPLVASILMGFNSALCCGIIGYIVVQMLAAQEIKKYGIKTGFFGLKKSEIEAKISQLQSSQGGFRP